MTYRVQTPTTDEVIETFPTATTEEIENTVITADEASKSWGQVGIEKRAAIVAKAAELFDARKRDLAEIIAEATKKPSLRRKFSNTTRITGLILLLTRKFRRILRAGR